MRIAGFMKTTLLDWPGKIAAEVFAAGCPLGCPFCHNSEITGCVPDADLIPEEDVLSFLRQRAGRGITEGVVVTGGEPLMQKDAPDFIGRIKEAGYAVKVDTSGCYPDAVRFLAENGLADFFEMDIKAPYGKYTAAAGPQAEKYLGRIKESAEILKTCGIPHAFRTTFCGGIHVPEDALVTAEIAGDGPYYIQNYRKSDTVAHPDGLRPFTPEELRQAKGYAEQKCGNVFLRV